MTHPLGDGIYRITLPLPFPSPQSVNCYLFEGEKGLTLLDCGIDGVEEFELLIRALEGFGFGLPDLHRLVASHLHVDHMGMAKRIIDTTGCDWLMHASTIAEIPHYNDWGSRRDELARVVEASGAPDEVVERFRLETLRPAWFSEAIRPTHPVGDGHKIPLSPTRHLEVIFTPGHQANHLCLLDSRTGRLFSGDHVLPRISPFIPYTGEGHDHLGAYLDSLERIAGLDARETYPGHGPTIARGSARAHQILLHHQRRLDAMLEVVAECPRTPWHVMQAVFRPNLSSLEERLAFQETMAHLEYLRSRSRVERVSREGRWAYRIPDVGREV
ncbi:MAG: MBL fold metallo-hydrolase [Acidimicrobiia bacterium]|nr:MBL fold metallo-hydrolase [Acidimicrobiia bacterium]